MTNIKCLFVHSFTYRLEFRSRTNENSGLNKNEFLTNTEEACNNNSPDIMNGALGNL